MKKVFIELSGIHAEIINVLKKKMEKIIGGNDTTPDKSFHYKDQVNECRFKPA